MNVLLVEDDVDVIEKYEESADPGNIMSGRSLHLFLTILNHNFLLGILRMIF